MENRIKVHNSDKPVCCFPVEIVVRDLDARLYLGLKCVREGFPCLIGSKGGVRTQMFNFEQPFIYFDKGLDLYGREFYEKIKASSGYVVDLQEEGGVYQDDDYILVAHNDETLGFVDLCCLWGQKQKDILAEHRSSFNEDTMVVTGHPRFDLRKKEFFPFYNKCADHQNVKGKYILVNTSFVIGNNVVSFEYEDKKQRKYLKDNYDPELMAKINYYQKLLVHYFVDAVKAIADEFPDLTVVLRPHPIENHEYYLKELSSRPNVMISSAGSVQEWIVDASLVIHHDCTTAIEAFFAEKKFVSYSPILGEGLYQRVPIEISDVMRTKADLVEYVRDFFNNADENGITFSDHQREKVREIIANVDFNSSEKIVNELERRFGNSKYVAPTIGKDQSNIADKALKKIRAKMKRLKAKFSDTAKAFEERSKIKFPGMPQEEVERKVKIFCDLDKTLPEVNVEKIKPDTYLITKK